MSTEKILPCPFCGRGCVVDDDDSSAEGWHLLCRCGYRSPTASSQAGAVRLHNDAPRTEQIERAQDEVKRLVTWLTLIDGGDRPCRDESKLRQAAYEAVVLRHEPPESLQ